VNSAVVAAAIFVLSRLRLRDRWRGQLLLLEPYIQHHHQLDPLLLELGSVNSRRLGQRSLYNQVVEVCVTGYTACCGRWATSRKVIRLK
jgi:hypothetical protein